MSSFKAQKYVQKGTRGENPERKHDADDDDDGHHERKEPKKQPQRYIYDERAIKANTFIDPLPENPKLPPNEKTFAQKKAKINSEIEQCKEERTKEKTKFKDLTAAEQQKIDSINDKIKLGEACIHELEFDLGKYSRKIYVSRGDIEECRRKIAKLKQKPHGRYYKEGKPWQQMSKRELEVEIEKFEYNLLKGDFNRKQSEAKAREIDHLKLLLLNATQDEEGNNHAAITRQKDIMDYENEKIKENIHKKIDTKCKIEAIQNQLLRLESDKKAIEQEIEKLKEGDQYTKSQQWKQKVYDLRKQRSQLEETYYNALDAYEDEQKKIKYIEWAMSIRKQKRQEEERQKERRRKEKQREEKRKEGKEDKDKGKAGEVADAKKNDFNEKRERPPPPHPFAKEIENCSFLTSYCQNLKPKKQETKEQIAQKVVDLQAAIKSGQWAKEKGVTIVESKKKDHDEPTVKKTKKPAIQKPVEVAEPKTLEHTIQVVRLFDNFKVVPPKTLQELEQTITTLKEKVDYYTKLDNNDKRGQQGDYKIVYKKKEDDTRPKKINLNIADFPSLI